MKGGRKDTKSPACPRTIEEVNKFYQFYLEGHSMKETDKHFNTDCYYQFKKHNLLKRSYKENTLLLRTLGTGYTTRLQYNTLLNTISNEKDAYILGLWFADGYISTSYQCGIRLVKEDFKLLEQIRDYICPTLTLKPHKNSIELVFSNGQLMDNLKKHGCVERKTYEQLSIPNMDESLVRHFIRGYYDGDGTIFMDKTFPRFNICSINPKILEEMEIILNTKEIETNINKEIRQGKSLKLPQGNFSVECKDMYRLFVRKKASILKLYDYLYKDSTIHLERKFIKFTNIANG